MLSTYTVKAAATADTLILNLDKDLAQQLLPFESIYQLALANSPLLKIEDGAVENRLIGIQMSRIAILSGVSATSNYNMGTSSVFSIGQTANEFYSQNNGYRVGVNVSLSLTELVSRRSKIQAAKIEYRNALARRDIARLQLKRDLFRAYQNLITSQKVLRLTLRDVQAGEVVFRLAEINYKKGKITPEDFAGASNTYTGLQILIEQKRADLITQLYDFEIMVGVELGRLTVN